MSPIEARAIADEHIEQWRVQLNRRPGAHWSRRWVRWTAREAWNALYLGRPYPGGGWERVRAEMVRWLVEHEEQPSLRRAA